MPMVVRYLLDAGQVEETRKLVDNLNSMARKRITEEDRHVAGVLRPRHCSLFLLGG
jgi:hypothetical protein